MISKLNEYINQAPDLCLYICLVFSFVMTNAQALNTSNTIQFNSSGQSLFHDTDLDENLIQLHLVNEHIPPSTLGKIQTIPDELPVSTLQVVWQTALNKCKIS